MENYYDKASMFSWMPLTGFDKDLPDKGVKKLMDRVGFDLNGVCLFLFHPDIVHHHDGLDKTKILPPDICSYYANPYNEERCRQEWTNQDLKALSDELKKNGTECFISIMGVSLNNLFHKEWIYDHPELLCHARNSINHLLVLKRFKDGTYYEDFFADKICQVMLDYGFSGLHVADFFCPQFSMVKDGDFSMDMLEQFAEYENFTFPDELIADREDTMENIDKRGNWIWTNCRAEWIEFLCRRWEAFFKKICDRLHAIGRKVFVLGMYCTDPFDTMYCKGVDLRRIVNAGVDYLMPNMAANSSSVSRNRHWPYYQWSNMMPLTDAFADNAEKLNMLAVKDASEEWDMLHHAPTLLDRDISFLSSYVRYKKDGSLKRCLDGYNICLGDGIYTNEWEWLKERFDVGFSAIPKKPLTPTFVWSDNVHYKMLREYITNRRWTPHKFLYELNWAGAHMGAIVRCDDLNDNCGDLFVANFDLLSEEEKNKIAAYRGGGVICTASADFKPEEYKINPEIIFTDENTPYKNTAFAFGMSISDKEEILKIANEADYSPALSDPFNAPESNYTLTENMPYQKVSKGFIKAIAMLIKKSYTDIFESTHPVVPMQMSDGALRIYVLNDDRLHYAEAVISVKKQIKEVKNISKFPLLPVKFSEDKTFNFMSPHEPGDLKNFRILVPQGGLGIVDVYFKD